MPWTRQKLNGRAPPEVCRWLMGLVAQHEKGAVVVAAEEALLQLVAEDENVCSLRSFIPSPSCKPIKEAT